MLSRTDLSYLKMGTAPESSKCSLRTVWSQAMDQYFINLMLEQVNIGNKIHDRVFTKRDWRHMTAMFNAKFNSKFEKDVLKNRHKRLRNLYSTIEILLEHKGFSWDESRKMVSADDVVWDEYIKAHPDVRGYRIKSIPYYSDLREIYKASRQDNVCSGSVLESDFGTPLEGEFDEKLHGDLLKHLSNSRGEDTEGSSCVSDMASDSLLHDIMINEDFGISVTKELSDITDEFLSDSIGCTRTYWHPPMDRFFIDLMLNQVNKGNQVNGQFRKQAWKEMLLLFNAKFGFDFEVDILKNRYKTLRRQYSIIKNLLRLDGFGWDRVRQMVVADDYVWRDLVKVHTEARKYMTRPVPYYEDLCLICRELNGDERGHRNIEILDEVREANLASVNQSPATSGSVNDQSSEENEFLRSSVNIRHQLPIASVARAPKRSRNEDKGIVTAIRDMETTALMYKGKGNEVLSAVPVEHVVAAIQELPDMDEDLVLDACDFLEDEKKAKTFLALDIKLRKKWLIRKLRPPQ